MNNGPSHIDNAEVKNQIVQHLKCIYDSLVTAHPYLKNEEGLEENNVDGIIRECITRISLAKAEIDHMGTPSDGVGANSLRILEDRHKTLYDNITGICDLLDFKIPHDTSTQEEKEAFIVKLINAIK